MGDVALHPYLPAAVFKPATIAALMAIYERRNDRPAALARSISGGWRAERSCCVARNAATWRQGKKIANEPLRVKAGERSERIVARDRPAKGRYGRGPKQPHRRAPAQRRPTIAAVTTPHQQRHWRARSAKSHFPDPD